MNIDLITSSVLEHKAPLLALPVFQGDGGGGGLLGAVDGLAGGVLRRARSAGDFKGGEGEALFAYASREGGGPERVLFLGVGREEEFGAEGVRGFVGRAVRESESRSLAALTVRLDFGARIEGESAVQAAAEGAGLAGWDFREFKSEKGGGEEPKPLVEEVTLSVEGDGDRLAEGLRAGVILARGENFARMLQSRPGNVATPAHLAEEAAAMAEEVGLAVEILGPKELEEEGMNALRAVSQGSEEEPRLIVLRHRGGARGEAPLVLVGKGLTFDAGGISLKPALRMEEMKYDMSGGAAVLGAMRAVAELGVALNVVGIVPSSENLPSGRAVKPGDVITTRAGKTVEVINTDAEGRLILSDALSYARTFEPAAIVDCATLTGACVVALGRHAAALLGTDEELIAELLAAGERSGERCWRLPLWKEYRKQLDSDVADLKNIGGGEGGTITAAAFLREFVGDVKWAHLDIAGTAYGKKPKSYQRKGGFGIPTRLLVEWVRARAGGVPV